jgi:hypothetical protein
VSRHYDTWAKIKRESIHSTIKDALLSLDDVMKSLMENNAAKKSESTALVSYRKNDKKSNSRKHYTHYKIDNHSIDRY